MEAGFGGPVWHASVVAHGHGVAEMLAERHLLGVGDASLGEWRLDTGRAFHLRRRLSVNEEAAHSLVMRDLRGTAEGVKRLRGLFAQHPLLRRHAVSIGEILA